MCLLRRIRPNDLGYWIGYKITESYFNKQIDKQKAIEEILNIKEPMQFLKQSGFLDAYIEKYQKKKVMMNFSNNKTSLCEDFL